MLVKETTPAATPVTETAPVVDTPEPSTAEADVEIKPADTPDLIVDDKGNVEEPWNGDNWAGTLEEIPEQHRAVAETIIARYTEQIAENEEIIKLLEKALDSTGDDPRLEQLRKDLEARTAELEAERQKFAKTDSEFNEFKAKYAADEQNWSGYRDAREAEDMARFASENPKLVEDGSKERARLEEILEDEGDEDLWDFWDLPQLVSLKKPEFDKVKKLRQEGVPTKYALQLVAKAAEKKADTRLPDDALAGVRAPSSRTPAPRTVKDAPDLKSKISMIAENAVLRAVK